MKNQEEAAKSRNDHDRSPPTLSCIPRPPRVLNPWW